MDQMTCVFGDARALLALLCQPAELQPAVDSITRRLEDRSFEVIHFHASGPGGRALEALARCGELAGVIDLTTSPNAGPRPAPVKLETEWTPRISRRQTAVINQGCQIRI